MTQTVAMQPLITIQGGPASTEHIIQPASGWIDGQEFKEIALDIVLLRNAGSTTPASLIIETAISPVASWTEIISFTTATYANTEVYCTAREGGTTKFRRYIRWRIDRSAAATPWTTCFRICATMKA